MDGLLLIDKPAGPTSHDVVDAVRRALRLGRAGHAGTLDPAATGLLLVLADRATRVAEYLEGFDKAYRVTVRLGVRTPTDDLASPPAETREVPPLDAAALEAALARFRGPILQRPPDYSALKVGGRRLYDLAREGRPAEPAPRPVTVHALELLAWRPPDLELGVAASAGTYVRALARDLGEALGCGGAVASLRRTAVGRFRVEDAVPLDALRAGPPGAKILPLDQALAHLPRVELRPEAAEKVRHGQVVGPEDLAPSGVEGLAPGATGGGIGKLADDAPCRLGAGPAFWAVGHVVPGSAAGGAPLIRPRKVFI
jgi:tRNA pseudouridine55 synthase